MKKVQAFALLVIVLLTVGLCSCGSNYSTSVEQYFGSFHSTYVDSQHDNDSLRFSLKVEENNTFVLTRSVVNKEGEEIVVEYNGYWKSYSENGNSQLICVMEGFHWNQIHPNAWTPYFSLLRLDDGTLMATPAVTSSETSNGSAFGSGSITKVTMVFFEQD